MPITSQATLEKAAGTAKHYAFNKALVSNQSLSISGWRIAGTPAAGSTPASLTPVILTAASTGAVPIAQAPVGMDNYLISAPCQTTSTVEPMLTILDRLVHNGTHSPTSVTAQICNIDASDAALSARIGASDFSEIQWWFEQYVSPGSSVGITVNVTYNDGTTGTVSSQAESGVANRMIPINSERPGFFIKSIQSFTQATSMVSGNIGITATRAITELMNPLYETTSSQWPKTGLPKIPRDAALMFMTRASTGTIQHYGSLRIGIA